jgi:alpha-tubulin suppressor-like RCC1 family protein
MVQAVKKNSFKILTTFISIFIVLFMNTVPSGAHAAVSPDRGPFSGGTAVSINGIRFVEVYSATEHALGLTSQGTLYAWGSNASGRLGNGTEVDSNTPVQVLGPNGVGYLSGVISIAAGYGFSMALTEEGLYTWGSNQHGQLGNGTNDDSLTPVKIAGPGYSMIAAGQSFALAANSQEIIGWGSNQSGQLGDGTSQDRNLPVQVLSGAQSGGQFLSNINKIVAGHYSSFAITSSGVYSWGLNFAGQLGDGTFIAAHEPVRVLGVGGVGYLSSQVELSAGKYHVLAILDSKAIAWGSNEYGQLGNESYDYLRNNPVNDSWDSLNVPVYVNNVGGGGLLTGVTDIAAGGDHSLAKTQQGVISWGRNSFGELGKGTINSSGNVTPEFVVSNINTTDSTLMLSSKITAGEYNSFVIENGNLISWGRNTRGTLGDGTTTDRRNPVVSVNFEPASVVFATSAVTSLSASDNTWFVVSPSGVIGPSTVTATASLFAGSVAATPATVSWNAGTFTYEAALANTSSPDLFPAGVMVGVVLLGGLTMLLGVRRFSRRSGH